MKEHIYLNTKYFGIGINFRDWIDKNAWKNCWMVEIPKYQNWHRFQIMTPLIDFWINGWLFFGKKPE